MIPLTVICIMVTSMEQNNEGKRTHRHGGHQNFRYIPLNLLLWISFLLNLILLPSSFVLESESEIEKSWEWSVDSWERKRELWVKLRLWRVWIMNESISEVGIEWMWKLNRIYRRELNGESNSFKFVSWQWCKVVWI